MWSTVYWFLEKGSLVAKARKGSEVKLVPFPIRRTLVLDFYSQEVLENLPGALSVMPSGPSSPGASFPSFRLHLEPENFSGSELGSPRQYLTQSLSSQLLAHRLCYWGVLDEKCQPQEEEPSPPVSVLWLEVNGSLIYSLEGKAPEEIKAPTRPEMFAKLGEVLRESDLAITYSEKAWGEVLGEGLYDRVSIEKLIKDLYGYFENYSLETAFHYLLDPGPDVFGNFRNLWGLFLPTYQLLSESLNLPYSTIGDGGEKEAFLLINAPHLLLSHSEARLPVDGLKVGYYDPIFIYQGTPLLVRSLTRSEDPLTRQIGQRLSEYPLWSLAKNIYELSELEPLCIPELESQAERRFPVQNYLGIWRGVLYSRTALPGLQEVLFYESLSITSPFSWLTINEGQFIYAGASLITHSFERLQKIVEAYLRAGSPQDVKRFIATFPASPERDLLIKGKLLRKGEAIDFQAYSNIILQVLRHLPHK